MNKSTKKKVLIGAGALAAVVVYAISQKESPFERYVKSYTDLVKAFEAGAHPDWGTTMKEWGEAHYKLYGQKEGRKLPA